MNMELILMMRHQHIRKRPYSSPPFSRAEYYIVRDIRTSLTTSSSIDLSIYSSTDERLNSKVSEYEESCSDRSYGFGSSPPYCSSDESTRSKSYVLSLQSDGVKEEDKLSAVNPTSEAVTDQQSGPSTSKERRRIENFERKKAKFKKSMEESWPPRRRRKHRSSL